MGNKQLSVTVFTPTYNRATLLDRLYQSLCNQTSKDFEWVIVDDGSTDNTEEICRNYVSNTKDFTIKYIHQQNGGKHRAINKGLEYAIGELFFIVDSDDWLRNDAIEIIINQKNNLPQNKKYGGVIGQKVYENGKIVGSTFHTDTGYIDAYVYQRSKLGISGDKSEVVFTGVMKQFSFPEIDEEFFCPEALVWNRMGEAGYIFRYFNEGIYYCEYQENGLTSNIDNLLINNIQGYLIYSKELIHSSNNSQKEKMACIANVSRRARLNGYSLLQVSNLLNIPPFLVFLGNIVATIVWRLH